MSSGEFHLNYSRDEDRVYVFVRDDEGVEHAFALTRHLFKNLWPALGKTVQAMCEAAQRSPAAMIGEVLSMMRENAVNQARESGALSNKKLPSAESRVVYLTRKVQIADGPKGGKLLIMTDGEKRIQIPMNFERLIVFCDALKTIVEKTTWDLKLAYPWEIVAQRKPGAAAASKPSNEPPTQH